MKIHRAIAMLLLTTVGGGDDRSGMAPSIARDRYQLVGMARRAALGPRLTILSVCPPP
jgi:hypothetical protein